MNKPNVIIKKYNTKLMIKNNNNNNNTFIYKK